METICATKPVRAGGKPNDLFQLVHHDGVGLRRDGRRAALLTIRHQGKELPIVAQATKQGFLYVFNRETGKPIWPVEEREVAIRSP